MPRWDFTYRYAGHEITQQRVSATWTERASVLSPTAFISSVNVQINPPFDFAATAANANPHSGYGELKRVDDAGNSRTVFRGRWTSVSFGGADDPVQITIRRAASDDNSTIPETYVMERATIADALENWQTAISAGRPFVSNDTWPDATYTPAIPDKGRAYTMVFGGPGDTGNPGSPGVMIDQAGGLYRIMIAGHHVERQAFKWWYPQMANGPNAGGSGTTDTLRTLTFTASDIEHVQDNRGRVVAIFDLDPAAGNADLDVDRVGGYYMAWTGGDATPGGAGDVIRRVMRWSSVPFDHHRSAAALDRLNEYQLDGYIDQPVPPLEWVTRTLMPLLPASLHSGVDGVYIKLWPWLDGGDEAAFIITTGTDFAPASLVTYSTTSASSVTLMYKWRPDVSTYVGETTASIDQSLFARIAWGLNLKSETLETRAVWDDATAQTIVRDRIRYGALPARTRRYLVDPSRYGIGGTHELRVGMPIKITDAEVSWSGLLAWIDEIERTADAMSVTVRIKEW